MRANLTTLVSKLTFQSTEMFDDARRHACDRGFTLHTLSLDRLRPLRQEYRSHVKRKRNTPPTDLTLSSSFPISLSICLSVRPLVRSVVSNAPTSVLVIAYCLI